VAVAAENRVTRNATNLGTISPLGLFVEGPPGETVTDEGIVGEERVRDIGEFGLIARLAAVLPAEVRASDGVRIGIGDDAAVWRPSGDEDVVVTTDSLVEKIHFRRDWTDWTNLGHKILAVNVSDLAAMGAVPRLAVVTLGLRGDELVRDLEALYRGLGELALRIGMVLAGGDIVKSPLGLAFHVTALGETRQRKVLTRSGARPGDIVGVTGTIGASAAGLRLLTLDRNDSRRLATTAEMLISAHLRPEPRVALGAALLNSGATAAMDLSDGLAGDLPKILAASGVSGWIDARRLPVAAAVRALFPEEWLELALRGGEDYELLFTAPPDAWDTLVDEVATAGGVITAIGEIVPCTADNPVLEIVDLDGGRRPLLPGAFDHFGGQSP
jgi:thiamine-monophosphate kinase